jgi:feruloyl esterase
MSTQRRFPKTRSTPLALAAAALCTLASTGAHAVDCGSLTSVVIPFTTVTTAALVTGGTFVPPDGTPAITGLPDFCRVAMTIAPTSDSHILVEAWLPTTTWNGRLEGLGGGGYTGVINWGALGNSIINGYAATNTDMGTSPATPLDGTPIVGHPEKWLDFGSRSTHEMTVAAKTMLQAYYAQEAKFAYWVGCSTGGHQGLLNAQVWADDYDGIVAGAPGHNRTHLHADFVSDFAFSNTPPAAVISPDKLVVLNNAVLKACAGKDGGLATDGFLSDPRVCTYNPAKLQCKHGDAPDCLTAGEVRTAQHMYDGLRNPDTNELIYPGWSRGSEALWFIMENSTGVAFPGIFNWALGLDYDPLTVNFDTDMNTVDATLLPTVNFMNTNLSRFTAHGGKLIVYHGWADPIVAPQDTVNYFHRLTADQQLPQKTVQGFARLFLAPGMSHCGGGPGPNVIDPLSALRDWVEKGIAPDSIVATKYVNDDPTQGVEMTRPLCMFPKEARYKGRGDSNDAANWKCASDGNDEPFQLTAPRYTSPFVVRAKSDPDVIDMSKPNLMITVTLSVPPGSDDFADWVPANLKAEGAAALTTTLSDNNRKLTATFRRGDLGGFTGGRPANKPVDLMITGTFQHDGVQSLFAASATVRLQR